MPKIRLISAVAKGVPSPEDTLIMPSVSEKIEADGRLREAVGANIEDPEHGPGRHRTSQNPLPVVTHQGARIRRRIDEFDRTETEARLIAKTLVPPA